MSDNVDHPKHYNNSGAVECIDVVRHMSFNLGNAVKYLWRHAYKSEARSDLRKAIWYIRAEIDLRSTYQWTYTRRTSGSAEAISYPLSLFHPKSDLTLKAVTALVIADIGHADVTYSLSETIRLIEQLLAKLDGQ